MYLVKKQQQQTTLHKLNSERDTARVSCAKPASLRPPQLSRGWNGRPALPGCARPDPRPASPIAQPVRLSLGSPQTCVRKNSHFTFSANPGYILP